MDANKPAITLMDATETTGGVTAPHSHVSTRFTYLARVLARAQAAVEASGVYTAGDPNAREAWLLLEEGTQAAEYFAREYRR